MKKLSVLIVLVILFFTNLTAQTTFNGTGLWSNVANWDNGLPDNTTDAVIADGAQCTIDIDAQCNNLEFAVNGTANSLLVIDGSNMLTVSGNILYSVPSADFTQTIDAADGTINCAGLTMPNSAADPQLLKLTANNATININGNLTMNGNGNRNHIEFTGNAVLNVSSSIGNGGRIIAGAATITIGADFNVSAFTAGTSTVVLNGAAAQRVDNVTYYNLTLDGGGNKYLVGNTTITTDGTLTFNNAVLNLAGYYLTLTLTATFAGLTSETNMIDFANGGTLIKTGNADASHFLRNYPVGTGSHYTPIEITSVTGSDVSGDLYISLKNHRHELLNGTDNALNRYWEIYSSNLTFSAVSAVFYYNNIDAQSPVTETNLVTIGRLAGTTWNVDALGTLYNHDNNTITFTNVADFFGTWTLGEAAGCFDATLPDSYTISAGNWNTAAIWNTGIVPAGGANVGILHAVTLNTAANPAQLNVYSTGSLNLNNQNITVTGNTNINGIITDNNNTGINTFSGLLTIEPGGSFTTGNSSQFVFGGGINNNGTFAKTGAGSVTFTNLQTIANTSGTTLTIAGTVTNTADGALTITNNAGSPIVFSSVFNTNANVLLTGADNITFSGAFNINGAVVVDNQNIATVTVTGALNGTEAASEWLNNNNSKLYYSNAIQPFNTAGVLNAIAENNTVVYGLNGNQTILTTGTTYNHLNIESGGTKTVNSNLNINGNLTYANLLANVAVNTTTNNVTVLGNIQAFNSGFTATFTQTTGTLQAKNLLVNGGNTFNLNSQATFSEYIIVTNNSVLGINSAGGVVVNILVRDIIVDTGSEINNANTTFVNNLTVSHGAVINGVVNLWLDANSMTNLIIDGDIEHNFTGTPTTFKLYNLTINPLANVTNAGFLFDIDGSVNIGSGSTFNAGGFNHTVLVNWDNSGTLVSTGTIVFDGATQNINTEPGFNNVAFTTAGTKTFTGDITIAGNLDISNATLLLGNNTTPRTHVINGNFNVNSGAVNTNNVDVVHSLSVGGSLTVNGSFDIYINASRYALLTFINNNIREINGTPLAFEINGLNLAAMSGVTNLGLNMVTAAAFINRGNVAVGSNAEFNFNGYSYDLYGDIIIDNDGKLTVTPGSELLFNAAGKSVQNSGELIISGTAGNLATVSATSVANSFYIDNLAGSALTMGHYFVDYLTGDGITAYAGATVDTVADNFSNGTFGSNCNSTQCLLLTNTDFSNNNPVTATNVVFNNNSTYNIVRTNGTGAINFVDATGTKAGESFDNDNGNPGTLINWSYPGSEYYTVSNGDFLNPAIWNADPSAHFTDASAVFKIMDNHTVTLNGDIDVLELIVGNGISGSLIIGNNADARTLTTREQLTVNPGGSVEAGSEAAHVVVVYGNLTNNGNINLRVTSSVIANVNFYGLTSGVSGLNPVTFNTVTFKPGSVTTAYTAMNIGRSVIIENGAEFNDGGLVHTVARDWTETGTGQRVGVGTINFNGTISTISATDATNIDFYNVVCSGAGAVSIASNTVAFTTNILGSLTVNDTKIVQLTDDNVNIAGDVTFNVGTQLLPSTTLASLVNFNGAGNQQINLLGDVQFYDVAFSNASVKTVNGTIKTTRYLTINPGAIVEGSANHEIGNTITVDGTCNFSGNITMKGGSITSTNTTINFNNLANLYIAGNIYLTTTTVLDVIVSGNVEIQTGYLIINNNTSLHGNGTGSFILGDALSLYIRDYNGFPDNFALYNIAPTSYVRYDRNMNQIVRGGANVTYGNLLLENVVNSDACQRVADGDINILGYVRFESDPVTFNLAGYNLTLDGNINTASNAIIDMTAGGTLTLNADDAVQTISAGTYNLTNMVFTLASPTLNRAKTIAAGANITMSGNLTATCGSTSALLLDIICNDNSITGSPQNLLLGQNCRLTTTAANVGTNIFNNFSGTVDIENGIVHFAKTDGLQYIPDGYVYGDVAFTGTQIKEATGNILINGDIGVVTNTPYFKPAGNTINIAGNWSLGVANTRVADFLPTDTIVFSGIDQSITASNFNNINVKNTGTATITGNILVYGDLNIKNGATFAAGIRNIDIYGNWVVEPAGFFTQLYNGTVNFVGTTNNQTIVSNDNSYFWNLTINKNEGADYQTVTANTNIVVKNNLLLTANKAVFNLNNYQLNIGGYFTVYNNIHVAHNSFIPGSSTVVFDGTDVQYIRHYSAYPLTFNNVVFSTTTNKMFNWDITYSTDATRTVRFTGNWTNNGQNVYGYVVNNAGNTWVNFEVAGNWVNNGTFYHLDACTVTFNGANQNIGSSDFWNVVFAGTGTKTLTDGNMAVKRNLTIADGVTLDVNELQNNNIIMSLNWDMSAAGAVFEARQALVRFDGNGTITTGHTGQNADKNFYNIEVSANVTVNGDFDVDNDFTVTSGTFTTGINTIYIGGNFVNNSYFTQNADPAAHVVFNASSGVKTFDPGALGVNFRKVTIDAPTATYNVVNNFRVYSNYDFTVNQGTFNLNGNKMSVYSNYTKIVINPGGQFIVDNGAVVEFTGAAQSIINQGGVFKLLGIPGSVATLTRTGGSYYVNQTAGTMHANYYRCEYIGSGVNGCITINGGDIDAVNNFSNGTFIGGASTATSTAYININSLDIDNSTNLKISKVTFNSGGTTNRNIDRSTPPANPYNGYIECEDCIGSLSGPTFETDDNGANTGYVRWTYPNGFFWIGAVSDDWHDIANWQENVVPTDAGHYVYLNEYGQTYPIARIYSANASCGRVIVNDGGSGLGVAVDNGRELTVYGTVVVSNGGSININSATSVINVNGDWTMAGTFNHGNGTINFFTQTEPVTITPGGQPFYNLKAYSPGGGTFTLGSAITIDNNFELVKGSFDVINSDFNIYGNWFVVSDSGAMFVPKVRTVNFAGADQTITNGTFYNFNTSGSGTKTVLTNIDINGTVNIGAATTLDGLDNDLLVAGGWINNGNFTQTGYGMVIFDGGNQQIDNTGLQTTQFNNLTFAGTGTKTFYKASNVAGNLIINSGCSVNFGTFVINGDNTINNELISNGGIYIEGYDNFPVNFETITLSAASSVTYRRADGDQLIKNSAAWNYGNLYLQNNSSTVYKKIPESGNLTVTGGLVISHTDVVLDMEANSANLVLTGNLSLVTGGQQINWGTGTTKLTHVGGDWNIDADIESFNNIELAGLAASQKRLYNNLVITGNVTVKAGVYLMMDPYINTLPKTMTSTGVGKTFTLENLARVYCSTPSTTDVAMPKNFASYNLHAASFVILRSPSLVDQTVYTGNGIVYGNITFQNTKNVTTDGIATFETKGNINMGACTFTDGGRDIITAGATTAIYNYTPTAGVTFTFNGTNQAINNNTLYPIILHNVVFAGSGSKTFGSTNSIEIRGNLTINPNVAVISGRLITFSGDTWLNNGKFRHTSTLTFNSASNQTINPGSTNADNYFTYLNFAGTNTVTFTGNGADINNTFTISNTCTVDMGTLIHTLAGSVNNTVGGTWVTGNADIIFDGASQNIITPPFTAANVILRGTGTKRMYSSWEVANLTIESSALNNYDAVSVYSPLTVHGNYINNGIFTHNNQSYVTFDANTDATIFNGTGTFWVVNFGNNTGDVNIYNITAPTNTVYRTINIYEDAHVKLNGNLLTFGYNTVNNKTITVNGILDIDANAILKFQNQGSVCNLMVDNATSPEKAVLRVVGNSMSELATITYQTTRGQLITVDNGTVEAKYYLIEYLANAGINITQNATLHTVNNFSYGTFSNINNTAGACYLNLEAGTYTGGPIVDVAFNITTSPVSGVYNVKRQTASPNITFDGIISGNLAGYKYEKDELTDNPAIVDDATRGKLQWPGVTETVWTGGINSDWDNAANWTDGVPTSGIDAIIPDVVNDPVLNVDAQCKKLRITNGTLELENGNNIIAYDDITIGEGTGNGKLIVSNSSSSIVCGGNFTRGTSGLFVHGNGTVLFNSGNGTVTVNPGGAAFYNVEFDNVATTFFLAGTNILIAGSLVVNNGLVQPSTSGYTLNIYGNFINNATFNPATGTVILAGTTDQTVTRGMFNNLTVNGTGIKYTTDTCYINGNTIVESTLQATTGSTIDFNGNVTINAGATFNDGGQTHTFSGATWTGTGNYSGSGTVVFDRTAANQTLASSKFNNLVVACTGRVLTLSGDVDIYGNITVSEGTARFDILDKQITNTTSTGSFIVENNTVIYITGYNNFPTNFLFYNLSATSTVNYRGDADQIIGGGSNVVYGNLTLTNTNTKSLGGSVEVLGNLYFNTATLDVTANNYSITINGQWYNNNAVGGTFVPNNGEVIFTRAGNQYIYVGDNSINPMHNVTVDKESGSLIAPNNKDLLVNGNLIVINGIYNANGRVTTVGGDLYAQNGQFAGSGTFNLNKASGNARLKTNYNYTLNTNYLNSLTISGNATYTLESDMAVYGDFIQQAGTVNFNGYTVALGNQSTDNLNVNGTIVLGAGGRLLMGNGSNFIVGTSGNINIVGLPDNIAVVTNNTHYGGRYGFTVNGTIAAAYYRFHYMDINGIRVSSTATIDNINNFSHGTFTNGAYNGVLLSVENTQSFVAPNYIQNVNFPVISTGSLAKNVAKTQNSGTLEFYEANGSFAGALYEKDDYNRVNWTGIGTLTWTGAASTSWDNPLNWSANIGPNIVPTGNEHVIIANATNKPKITGAGKKTKNLTINNGARLIIETPYDAAETDLEILGDLTILGSATFTVNSINDFVVVAGNLTVSASSTYTNNGNFIFNGNGANNVIDNGGKNFYNITIAGTSLYSLGRNTTIKNNLVIEPGASFDASNNNYSITISGSWLNTGNFYPQTGTVIFVASSGTRSINNNSSKFHHIIVNAPGVTYNLASNNLYVNGNFTLQAGNFNQNGYTVNMGDGNGTDYMYVSGSAVYTIGANGTLKMGNNATVSVYDGGQFFAVGTDNANPAVITRQLTGTYAFEVESLGNFAAQHYQFEYMNANGIYLKDGAVLNSTYNLSDGVFSNGPAGGTFLTLENILPAGNDEEVISNVTFNNGALYNVKRTSGTTVANFKDATGLMGAHVYEYDSVMPADPITGLLIWSSVNNATWLGTAADHNWHNPANWLCNCIPSNINNIVVLANAWYPVITDDNAFAKRITIEPGGILVVDNKNLSVAEDIYSEGTITVNGTPSIEVGQNYTNLGTFEQGNSTIIFNGIAGNYTIEQGSGDFYNFEINSGATYMLNSNLNVSNNVGLITGTLNTNGFNIYFGGNWQNTGATFVAGTRTVYYNGTGTGFVNNGASSFYNFNITGTGYLRLQNNIIINNQFSQSAGSFDLSPDDGVTSYNLTTGNRLAVSAGTLYGRGSTITVGENWAFTGSSVFNCGTSTIIMAAGSGTKSISPKGQQFNNLTINAGGTYNLASAITINNNLTILAGTLNTTTYNYAVNIGGNWLNSSLFIGNNSLITFNGANEQSISGAGTQNFGKLTLQNSCNTGIVLHNPVNITQNLNLVDGLIFTDALNLLTLTDNATSNIGNDTSFVNGPMKKVGNDAFIFPVGNDSVWAPLGISAPALTTDAFTATYFLGPNSNSARPCANCGDGINYVSIVEYWDIDRTNGVSVPNVTMYFKNMARSAITDINDVVFAHWNGVQWEAKGSNTAVADGVNSCHIIGTGFTGYSPVAPASKANVNPLPVELISFIAKAAGNSVNLYWTTASEWLNDYFTVERATNVGNFEQIDKIAGAGYSSSLINYSVTDKVNAPGIYYYRLKQTDYNGQFTYSNIVAVNINSAFNVDINLYPNPAQNNQVFVNITNAKGVAHVQVVDALGRLVFNQQFNITTSSFNVNIADYCKLAPGSYNVIVLINNKKFNNRLIINH